MNSNSGIRNFFRSCAGAGPERKFQQWDANAVFKYIERYRDPVQRRNWKQEDNALVLEEMIRIRATIHDMEWQVYTLLGALAASEIPTVVAFVESLNPTVLRNFMEVPLSDRRFAPIKAVGGRIESEIFRYFPDMVNRLCALVMFGWVAWGILIIWPTIYALRALFTADAGDGVVASLAAARPLVAARFVRFAGTHWWADMFYVLAFVVVAFFVSLTRRGTEKAA